jgi:anti-sigma regulatory factor (Ser/Thr protein kinase)
MRMPEGLPAPVRLVLATDLVFVRAARKMIEGLLHAYGWDEETVEEVALVATELVQNAIEHGSRNDGTETAELELRLEDGAIVLEMSDPGSGKDPSLLLERDVEQPVPLDAARGRGLFLVNRLSAEFERSREASGGCRVRARMEADA